MSVAIRPAPGAKLWLILLGGLDLLAWWWLWRAARAMDRPDLEGRWMPPTGSWHWSPETFGAVFLMWCVMMAAMMLPAAMMAATALAPLLQRWKLGTLRMGLGYLSAWWVFSATTTLLQWVLHATRGLTPMMEPAGPVVSGLLFLLAGAYQWTAWKDTCLHHCRSPLGMLLRGRHRLGSGPYALGLRHGAYCIGCCWSQMVLMFAIGVMSLVWMGLITATVLVERIPGVPARPYRWGLGSACLGFGGYLLLSAR